MNVELASADLHAGMVEAFGLPTPTEDAFEELVGAYHFEDRPTYWFFKPHTETWRVAAYNGHRNPAHFSTTGWSNEDRTGATTAMRDLAFLPAPDLPSNTSKIAHTDPFVFRGWIFAWRFTPEVRAWTLTPLTRR